MTTKMVEDGEGGKYLSCWKLLTNSEMEEFVLKKCERYLGLK